MVSPFPHINTDNEVLVKSSSESENRAIGCTSRCCYFCYHHRHHKRAVLSYPSKTAFANENYHKELRFLAVGNTVSSADKMTSSQSQIIAPLRHKLASSVSLGSSSSFGHVERGCEQCCKVYFKGRNGGENNTTSMCINCKECDTWLESLSGDEFEQTCSRGWCCCCCGKKCAYNSYRSGGGGSGVNSQSKMASNTLVVTASENGDGDDDTRNFCFSGDSISLNRARYFPNEQLDTWNKTCDDDDEISSQMKGTRGKVEVQRKGGGSRCKSTRLSGVDRRFWLLCTSLLFLSLAGSTCSFSVFDDEDDDDFSGGISQFHIRSRRSAEQFSSLHDALSLIPSNYSIHEPPPTNNSEATQVDFSVLIMNVRDIKELNEGYGDLELSLEMNLRIYWKDTRLSHLADRSGNKFIVLNPVLLDKLWHPDIFIDHVKGVAQPALISKPASLRVYPDSSVRYSARITVTMACQMDFHYYPADTQRCNVDMKSYAYSSKILALDWREGKGAVLVEYLELPNFDVALDTTQNFMVNTSSGSYFTILFRRKLSYHLIQTYLPSTLFIIVSWLSFLVPPESVPGRMALCMTTLLTLTAMFSAVRQNTPNVSYVKALDIWMVVCIIFVFLTLVEYTVLLKLKSKKTKPKPPASAHPERALTSAQPPQLQQAAPPSTRWTIPSLQYTSDNVKFRGCKTGDGVISENGAGTNGEMRHRENGDSTGAASGDNVNINTMNIPVPPSAPPSAHPPPALPLPPPPPPMGPAGERPLNKYELAAKKIEKFTSAVIPTLFVIFQFIYWPWLINSSEYYHQDKSTTIFKSM